MNTLCRQIVKRISRFQPRLDDYMAFKRSTSQLTTVHQENGIRKIIMNHSSTRNSLSMEMVESLIQGLNENIADTTLRCVVISAQGKVFSAGHNLKELETFEGQKVFSRFNELMMMIIDCPVPVLAAVDGLAAAAGCQLVAQCDMAICTNRSSFSTPGANFGIFCSTPGIALSRAVSRKVAAHMLFTGQPITSQEALTAGLVSKVVNENSLESEVDQITSAIKAKSRSVVELGKRFFYLQLQLDLERAYVEGAKVMVRNLSLDDGREGLRSFIEKRKPVWIDGFTKTRK